MDKIKKQGASISLSGWILLFFMPALMFPAFWLVASMLDWFMGDSNVFLRISYDSKGKLLNDFLADWKSAIPISIGMSWLVILPTYYFFIHKGYGKIITYFSFGVAAWLILGLWLYHIDMVGLLTMIATGGLFAGGLLFLKWLSGCFRRCS